jgi:predicted CXXCH cytochrome family protein
VLFALLLACGGPDADEAVEATQPVATANPHATGAPCADCHADAHAAWAGSRHARAQTADVDAPRFDGVARAAGALTVTPGRTDGAPSVTVRDATGTTTLPVLATIGVGPLQQYVLDAGSGKRLIAPLAYDVTRGDWYDPAPDGAVGDPKDPMHWAGLAGTWNHQCAACHTTGFAKGYDPAAGAYASAAAHDHVACTACHGPATAPRALSAAAEQLDACAGCHSRREPLTCDDDPTAPFLDRYRPALIDSGAFLSDGRGAAPTEPFEWAPFAQSRMAAAGVRCTDCHDAHTGALARPGDATCTGCHADIAAGTARGAATHPATADCVSCHMPTALYMGVHARHDHSLRRPGDARHAAVFGPALAGDPAAVPGLVALAGDRSATAFDRASALALLRRFPPPTDAVSLRTHARDTDALVRAEAVATLGSWGDADTARVGLADPVRAVRFAAIEAYVAGGGDVAAAGPAFAQVLAEVEALAACDDDLPSTHQNLGRLRAATGDRAGAIAAFEALQRLDPSNETAARALTVLRGGP